MSLEYFFIGIAVFGCFLFIARMLGAWLLRINDVIKELREIKTLLKKQTDFLDEQNEL